MHKELLTGNFTLFFSKGLTLQRWYNLRENRSALLNMKELGSGARQIGPISGYISTHQQHAPYFQLMMPTTKLIKKFWNLPKSLGEKAVRPSDKRGNAIPIQPTSYKSDFFINEILQHLVDKYQITYQNIRGRWGKGNVVRSHSVELGHHKILKPLMVRQI